MRRVRVIILAAVHGRAASGLGGTGRSRDPAEGSGPRLALHARVRRDAAALRLRAVLRAHAGGVPAGPAGGAALLGDARAPERARRPQPRRQPRDRARHRHGDLRRGRILDHPDHQGRLRGLRAAEAQAPDGARLACERAADDGGARREGRGPRRADGAHGAGRFHPRQQGRRGEVVEPHPLRVHHAAVLSQSDDLDVAGPAGGQLVAADRRRAQRARADRPRRDHISSRSSSRIAIWNW